MVLPTRIKRERDRLDSLRSALITSIAGWNSRYETSITPYAAGPLFMNHKNFVSPAGALAGTANCIAKVILEPAGISPGEQFSSYDADATVPSCSEYAGHAFRLTALLVGLEIVIE